MGEQTNISWTDSTHNFWRGCTKVSPGCTNCYAETLVTTRLRGEWGKGKPRVRAKDFNAPLRWHKHPLTCDCGLVRIAVDDDRTSACPKCQSAYRQRRVFSLSLGDWLDSEVPIEWLADMLRIVHACQNLNFLLLTKRPENWNVRIPHVEVLEMEKRMSPPLDEWPFIAWLKDWIGGKPPQNVWVGVSVEDQQRADERMNIAETIPAAIRFISYEPALEHVDFHFKLRAMANKGVQPWSWLIAGGESGPGARPCDVEWIRDGIRQCKEADVKAFTKQLGSKPIWNFMGKSFPPGTNWTVNAGSPTSCLLHLKDKKGGNIAEFPEDLRVREWPDSRH